MELLQTVLSFLVVIGVLVFVHELGHFLTAKWTGMRADVFALGMGRRLFGWNWRTGFTFGPIPEDLDLEGRTDYRLCMLPIGGYVKIVGMIDESFDTEFVDKAPQPYEFRVKKNWQKALVLVAGVVMNILFAIAVFWAIPMFNGREEHVVSRLSYVEPGSVAQRAGLQAGDQILRVDGKPVSTWEEIGESFGLIASTGLSGSTGDHVVDIRRGSEARVVRIPGRDVVRAMAAGQGLGMNPEGMRVSLAGVVTLAPAGKAGLQAGDVILAADSMAVRTTPQLQKYVRAHAGRTLVLHVERKGTTLPIPLTVSGDSTIGVELAQSYVGETRKTTYGPLTSLSMAIDEVGGTISMIGASVTHVFRGDVSVKQSFGGPIRIAQMASRSSELGAEAFFRFMALISISLAVMNLLPLPGLDGGHLVFVGIESIIRREIPTNVKMRFQQVGVALLLGLMVFVIYLDITR